MGTRTVCIAPNVAPRKSPAKMQNLCSADEKVHAIHHSPYIASKYELASLFLDFFDRIDPLVKLLLGF